MKEAADSLAGRRVLVTRPPKQARELVSLLETAGAEAIALPTIAIIDPPDWEPADRALADLTGYQWLLLTSVNGVERFFRRLEFHRLPPTVLNHLETVCVGPKTAGAARNHGLECRTVAKEYAAEGILALFAGRNLENQAFLFPRALKARELLVETLRKQGARVDLVPVYQTIFPATSAAELNRLLADDAIDIITLTSASTATNLAKHCAPGNLPRLQQIPAVCIGPVTAEAAAKAGLEVAAVADEYTSEGLFRALARLFR
ncbi:MAG: uroporphyrinogen-III synthase [Deltaproteobacteria bacterium]|nr:uroporphyrinogen-III synthase [Deltaproteobacteria bacterium]